VEERARDGEREGGAAKRTPGVGVMRCGSHAATVPPTSTRPENRPLIAD
jgi:hypothetical protein